MNFDFSQKRRLTTLRVLGTISEELEEHCSMSCCLEGLMTEELSVNLKSEINRGSILTQSPEASPCQRCLDAYSSLYTDEQQGHTVYCHHISEDGQSPSQNDEHLLNKMNVVASPTAPLPTEEIEQHLDDMIDFCYI